MLSSAVAKEIHKNIRGIQNYEVCSQLAAEVLSSNKIAGIAKSRYVNDKQITDHYAIIPTGQGLSALRSLNPTAQKVYEIIVRRFLSIFYPPAIYRKVSLTLNLKGEQFFASFKVLEEEGYLKAARASFFNAKKKQAENEEEDKQEREAQQRKLQIRTGGEDRDHQIDQEWEQIRSSCHKVETCRELGEVYRVNKGNFAVLPESMKHILQNSFLVHGLMNYGYLLLFRVDEKVRQFGVGVPGVYYEKEKLVAEMFGFPQFWCDGRSDNGKFGYYLRIVS